MPRLVIETPIAQRSPICVRISSARSWKAREPGVVATVLRDDAEVRQQAAHARLVAQPLADAKARLVVLHGFAVVAPLCCDGADKMENPADAALLAGDFEAGCRAIEQLERLVETSLLARHLRKRRLAGGAQDGVVEALGERERLAVDLLRATPVADELEHLAELEQHIDACPPRPAARAARNSRSPPCSRRRLRRVSGAAEELAFLLQVLAVPVVVREQIEVVLDRVGLGFLDVAADALVQHRAERERHALVSHFLGDDVLEQVRLLGLLLVDVDEVDRASTQVPSSRRGSELRIDARSVGARNTAAEDARHLERAPRRLAERVDAAQDQAVQALRQLERFERRLVLRIDALAANELSSSSM